MERSILIEEIERLSMNAARREIHALREELFTAQRETQANRQTEIVPSIKHLADRLGVSETTISNNLNIIPHHRLPDSKRVFFVLDEVLEATLFAPDNKKILDYKKANP